MITSEIASKRLNLEPRLIDDIFLKLDIDSHTTIDTAALNEMALVSYLDKYIVSITTDDLRKVIRKHKSIKEIILSLTCKSGSIYNLEPIWIIFKIVMYKIPACEHVH